ncbi:hypothetical protein [uncultured Maribacter sp.]|uniref:hypothetical protein n=1 Tax=uncultured Maribacter sp. TaxID=431308 RepID=UPI002614E70B|nr:hypothetical protein [uncultured Maribacter sp.]
MPVKSYLAYPLKGAKKALHDAIAKIDYCEVVAAENKDLLIVITDTKTQLEDENTKQQIETISNLKLLTLVSGFNTPKN